MIVSNRVLSLTAALAVSTPVVALAQAAVNSDTPVPRRSAEPGGAAAIVREGTDPSLLPTPNPTTAPGSPGTTGTGAAGTGPTNTMAAPGR